MVFYNLVTQLRLIYLDMIFFLRAPTCVYELEEPDKEPRASRSPGNDHQYDPCLESR